MAAKGEGSTIALGTTREEMKAAVVGWVAAVDR